MFWYYRIGSEFIEIEISTFISVSLGGDTYDTREDKWFDILIRKKCDEKESKNGCEREMEKK